MPPPPRLRPATAAVAIGEAGRGFPQFVTEIIHLPGAVMVHTVLVVEDHADLRYALIEALDTCTDLAVVAEVGTIAAALTAAADQQPDLIICDNRLPDGSGLEAVVDLRRATPSAQIIIWTASPVTSIAGASVVAKQAGLATLLSTARRLLTDNGSPA